MEQWEVTVASRGLGCALVTDLVFKRSPRLAKVEQGVAFVYLLTARAASITLNENCDPTVQSDLTAAVEHIVPGGRGKGGVRAALLSRSLALPVTGGRFDLGTWQGLYLCEWDAARDHTLVITVCPTAATHTTVASTGSRGCRPVTAELPKPPERGLMTVLLRHTSASIGLSGVGDEATGTDLETALNRICPEQWNSDFFVHTYEGPDDMPGHVKSAVVGASIVLPCSGGQLQLGASQGVYLCEHRNGRGRRRLCVSRVSEGILDAQTLGIATTAAAPCLQIADAIAKTVSLDGCSTGVCHVHVQGHSASLSIAPSDGLEELATGILSVVGKDWKSRAEVASMVFGMGLTIPVRNGQLLVPEGQAVVLCGHGAPAEHALHITLVGKSS